MTTNSNLRNIGIVAHVDAGKTTITEQMLYVSGGIRTAGSVDKGTAHTDWLDIERTRGISVRSASISFIWKGININLIDTPGHVDFSAEVERSLRVLDCAILVVSAVEGVQAQTEILWSALKTMKIPTLIFINKIDRVGSDVSRVLKDLDHRLSPNSVTLQEVLSEGTPEPRVNDIWKDEGNDKFEKIIDILSSYEEDLLERYIGGEVFSPDELKNRVIKYVQRAGIFPVLYGTAIKGIGITELLDAVAYYFPNPVCDVEKPLSGVVFKIEHDKLMGKIAYVRLYNGIIKNRDSVFNLTQNIDEKVTQIRKVYAQKHEDIGILSAGDIAAICGFGNARVGDILGNSGDIPSEYKLAVPLLKIQAYPETNSEYPQLVSALKELSCEDPLLDLQWLKEERELHLKIMGVIQLEVLTSLLKSRFKLNVSFGKPSVIYKETPASIGEGFVAYTMPKPCWAVLRFKIEPGERGSGLVYSSTVREEKILLRYQNQVEKTMSGALQQGLYGWEVTDLKVTLTAGEHHLMHTHPLDFVVATPMAIMNGLSNTGTKLLEPILHFSISVPEDIGGKILGDLVQMRGVFDSPVISQGLFCVEGSVPVATSLDYPIKLASISGGRGIITTRFIGYTECLLEFGATTPRRGVNPLDTAKYILHIRNALS